MERFLFTDGINGVKEAASQDELQALIDASPNKNGIKIWIYNSSEWLGLDVYLKRYPAINKLYTEAPSIAIKKSPANSRKNILKKLALLLVVAAGVFIVYNFTQIKWESAEPIKFTATRPPNVPLMDVDSLVDEIEFKRAEKIDRNTRNNLRLRNTWPERVLLGLTANHEKKSGSSRYSSILLSVDNTTGYTVDKAIVELLIWKKGRIVDRDTFQFDAVSHGRLSTRSISDSYVGDSLSIYFQSVRAKGFNFCYSSNVKNNSGNYNDRWFCREP